MVLHLVGCHYFHWGLSGYQHPDNNFSFLNQTSSLYPYRRQPNGKIFCIILVKAPGVNKKPLVCNFHARQFKNPEGLERQVSKYYACDTVSEFYCVWQLLSP